VEIKVLGAGCHDCLRLELLVGQVLEELGVQADLNRVDDPREIERYVLVRPPGLVIDGVLAVEGRVPGKEEIRAWIAAAPNRGRSAETG
jgi:small redox-active disulfide protein 2